MWQYNYGFGIFSFLSSIIWLFLVVYIVVHIFRRYDRRHAKTTSAEDILAERFAKGEIDEDEYKKRLDTLRKHAK